MENKWYLREEVAKEFGITTEALEPYYIFFEITSNVDKEKRYYLLYPKYNKVLMTDNMSVHDKVMFEVSNEFGISRTAFKDYGRLKVLVEMRTIIAIILKTMYGYADPDISHLTKMDKGFKMAHIRDRHNNLIANDKKYAERFNRILLKISGYDLESKG